MDNPIQKQNNMPRPGGPLRPPMAPSPGVGANAMAMTPKEIVGIFRRHLWMIIILTLLGLIIGGVSWFLFDRYLPKYTAIGGVNVSSPGIKDPT